MHTGEKHAWRMSDHAPLNKGSRGSIKSPWLFVKHWTASPQEERERENSMNISLLLQCFLESRR